MPSKIYELRENGVQYELFATTNSKTSGGPFPVSGEDELYHLKLIGRPNFFTRADTFITIPAKSIDRFFNVVVSH